MNAMYDIIETANQAGYFRVLLYALEATGLKESLQLTGPYTVFAPVDDAFVRMSNVNLESLFNTKQRDSLRLLLSNHIVSGKLLSQALKDRDEVTSIKGEQLRIESRAGLWINEAEIVSPDLEAANGVLHGINTVLTFHKLAAAAS